MSQSSQNINYGGPGDGLKKLLRNTNNVSLGAGFGSFDTGHKKYIPYLGFNATTEFDRGKNGWFDTELMAGYGKDGFAGGIDGTYFGPFGKGNRHFHGAIDFSTMLNKDKFSANFTAGPNYSWGKPNKELRRGRAQFSWMPFGLRVGMNKEFNNPDQNSSDKWQENFGFNWGYGTKAQGKWRPKKLSPLELFGEAQYNANLVERMGQATGEGYQEEKSGLRPEHLFMARAGIRYPLGEISFNRSRKRNIPKLVENVEPVLEIPPIKRPTEEIPPITETKIKRPRKQKPPTSARHPRWLKNGGSMAPIIPTYYKSKGTPIYRDTTDAPPTRILKHGGPHNPSELNIKTERVYPDTPKGRRQKRRDKKDLANNSSFEKGGKMDGGPQFTQEQIQEMLDQAMYGRWQDLDETTVYGNKESKLKQNRLWATLQSLKDSYNDWYHSKGFDKGRDYDNTKKRIQLRQKVGSDFGTLEENINQYKDFFKKNKKKYKVAEEALRDLKKYYPDTWGKKKLKDVFSSSGYEALRSLSRNDKIDKDTWLGYYNNFGIELDPFLAKGKGPNKVYDGTKLEKVWGKDYPDFISMVNKLAIAAPLIGGAGALAMTGPGFGATNAVTTSSNFTNPFTGIMNRPILQGVLGNTTIGNSAVANTLTLNNALSMMGASHVGHEILDKDSATKKAYKKLKETGDWKDFATETGVNVLSASPFFKRTFNVATEGAKGFSNIIKQSPFVRDFRPGLRNVVKGQASPFDLFRSEKFTQWQPNWKSAQRIYDDAGRDMVTGRWFTNNPATMRHYRTAAEKSGEGAATEFFTTKAAAADRYLGNLWKMKQAGISLSAADELALSRSIAERGTAPLNNFLKTIENPTLRAEVERLSGLQNSYWKDPVFKGSKEIQKLVADAPPNPTEYLSRKLPSSNSWQSVFNFKPITPVETIKQSFDAGRTTQAARNAALLESKVLSKIGQGLHKGHKVEVGYSSFGSKDKNTGNTQFKLDPKIETQIRLNNERLKGLGIYPSSLETDFNTTNYGN